MQLVGSLTIARHVAWECDSHLSVDGLQVGLGHRNLRRRENKADIRPLAHVGSVTLRRAHLDSGTGERARR